ncbi:MAG: hypothetical protein IKM11_04615 [Oscillospiraceae bacterium]|nr:hypothetical protein [Oscillospiraceae bacterium]
MNRQVVAVQKGTFKSPLVPIAAVLFAVAAVCGALAVLTLFHPASISAIINDLELGQIYDPNAQRTWLVIYIAETVLNCLGTLVLSSSFMLILLGRHYTGTNLLYYSAKCALVGVNISGAAVLPYFIYRFVRYLAMYLGVNGSMVMLFSMVVMEGMMGAQAVFLFIKLRQFLNCSVDTAASIGYTLASGKLKAPSIPPLSVSGFLVLGIFDIGIALDRFFTFVHIQINLKVIYEFPMTTDPVQIVSGLSFAFAALGSILLYFYLRGYKCKSEKLLIRSFDEPVA